MKDDTVLWIWGDCRNDPITFARRILSEAAKDAEPVAIYAGIRLDPPRTKELWGTLTDKGYAELNAGDKLYLHPGVNEAGIIECCIQEVLSHPMPYGPENELLNAIADELRALKKEGAK
jgi:hypothetical protein